MFQVNLDAHNLLSTVFSTQLLLCMSFISSYFCYYYACHLYRVISDMLFQMKNSFVKATKRHLSESMGRVCYGRRLLSVEFVMGRVPKPSKLH